MEIEQVGEVWSQGFLDRLKARGEDLSPETLVYYLREAHSIGYGEIRDTVHTLLWGTITDEGRVVGGFCEGIIRKGLKKTGLPNDAAPAAHDLEGIEEFRSETYRRLWVALVDEPLDPFWEELFGLALARLVANVARERRDSRETVVPHADLDDPAPVEELPEDEATSDDSVLKELTRSLARETIMEALHSLPERTRLVFMLRVFEDLPFDSIDPSQRTIKKELGVKSEQTGRNHYQRAVAFLSAHPLIKKYWEDSSQ